MSDMRSHTLESIGFTRSILKGREEAIQKLKAEILKPEMTVCAWLHEARRDVLMGHPRSDESHPLTDASIIGTPVLLALMRGCAH